jgi:hypothetical protein
MAWAMGLSLNCFSLDGGLFGLCCLQLIAACFSLDWGLFDHLAGFGVVLALARLSSLFACAIWGCNCVMMLWTI